jgi:hypothetical protein
MQARCRRQPEHGNNHIALNLHRTVLQKLARTAATTRDSPAWYYLSAAAGTSVQTQAGARGWSQSHACVHVYVAFEALLRDDEDSRTCLKQAK